MSPAPILIYILCWLAYLLATAWLWMQSIPLALLAVVTLGGYLAVGVGYFRHELYHNYYKPFGKQLYHITSYLVFSDPQVFSIAHPTHHGDVHTLEDLEFFCAEYGTNPRKRRRQFLLELLFGNMMWEGSTIIRLRRAGKWNRTLGRQNLLGRLLFLSLICWLSVTINPGSMVSVLAVFWLTLWWGALVSRHNQFLEHLGIVSDGSFEERNMLTRNLPDDTLWGWLWNLYNHNDPRAHLLHHTKAGINSRALGIPLPEGARETSVPEYLSNLLNHYRKLRADCEEDCSADSVQSA